jgi:hypothetical protein
LQVIKQFPKYADMLNQWQHAVVVFDGIDLVLYWCVIRNLLPNNRTCYAPP